MQKNFKNDKKRLKKQFFSKCIGINKDISELKDKDLYSMLNKSLTNNIFINDLRNRKDHVDENNILKPEFIKYLEYNNTDSPLFNITKDNKLYMNINISIGHYSKIRDIDWLKYINNLSKNSGIPFFEFIIL